VNESGSKQPLHGDGKEGVEGVGENHSFNADQLPRFLDSIFAPYSADGSAGRALMLAKQEAFVKIVREMVVQRVLGPP
jgi:hypothetical protein